MNPLSLLSEKGIIRIYESLVGLVQIIDIISLPNINSKKMRKKIFKLVKKIVKRMLSGDKHVWGWVTLDITNPLPPTTGLNASV